MAEQGGGRGSRSGPGNTLIATTLLESLAVRGRTAARDRAVRALGLAEGGLAEAPAWLADDAFARMFFAADVERALARSIGRRLIEPDVSGLRLYGLGLATPEKAYRRVQSLLPRESTASFWRVDEIRSGGALLCFHDKDIDAGDGDADQSGLRKGRGGAGLCALRIGMLEAIPGLYGLLPARVEESTCLAHGGDACRYEVHWERRSRVGLVAGGGIGLAAAGGLVAEAMFLGSPIFSIAASAGLALGGLALAIAIGWAFDLHRQLEAVVGARRGHLDLFDQVDDALASKLDALARADAQLESGDFSDRVARRGSVPTQALGSTRLSRSEILVAAQLIHAAAGDLECRFEQGANPDSEALRDDVGKERRLVREIREQAARIAQADSAEGDRPRQSVDLALIVARAIAAARPMLPREAVIEVDSDEDLKLIACEPVQMEQVVVQLVRNAAEASHGLSEPPEVFISLRNVARGVELSVEDRGVSIESSELDEVFDPFSSGHPIGVDGGFGLPTCLRIVERHGGELRIESEDRVGTRVSVVLPESLKPER